MTQVTRYFKFRELTIHYNFRKPLLHKTKNVSTLANDSDQIRRIAFKARCKHEEKTERTFRKYLHEIIRHPSHLLKDKIPVTLSPPL
jgi:oligoendopeptidase F